MNPLLWWWRWWSRVINPNRDDALVQAQELIEQQREEANRLSSQLEAKDDEIAALQARLSQVEHESPRPQTEPDSAAAKPAATSPPDVSMATKVLGTSIKLDDLTVIEGIGPKIADLLSNAGFSTWRALSEADTAELRRVLEEAGPRYRVHDPSKWPSQAELLAQGRWQDYKDLTAKVRSRTS